MKMRKENYMMIAVQSVESMRSSALNYTERGVFMKKLFALLVALMMALTMVS